MSAIAMPALRISSRSTIDFYVKAFGATLVFATDDEGDAVGHAELTIDGAMFMCGTGREGGVKQPVGGGGTYWVLAEGADVDRLHAQALAAGATELFAPYDADYGGRHTTVRDPDGNVWSFGTYRPEGV